VPLSFFRLTRRSVSCVAPAGTTFSMAEPATPLCSTGRAMIGWSSRTQVNFSEAEGSKVPRFRYGGNRHLVGVEAFAKFKSSITEEGKVSIVDGGS
jgi:hypothetical protein